MAQAKWHLLPLLPPLLLVTVPDFWTGHEVVQVMQEEEERTTTLQPTTKTQEEEEEEMEEKEVLEVTTGHLARALEQTL